MISQGKKATISVAHFAIYSEDEEVLKRKCIFRIDRQLQPRHSNYAVKSELRFNILDPSSPLLSSAQTLNIFGNLFNYAAAVGETKIPTAK